MIKVQDKGSFNIIKVNKMSHKSEDSSIQVLGNNNNIYIESRCSFKDFRIIVKGDNNQITIKRGAWFLGGAISVASFSKLEIGERSSFGSRLELIIESADLIIGDDCMASSGLTVRTTDTHGIYNLDDGKLLNNPENVNIGDYVWIRKDVYISKGSKIGSCCVIDERSVFQDNSGDFELWAGQPAVKVSENVMWSKSAHLNSIYEDTYASMYVNKYRNEEH